MLSLIWPNWRFLTVVWKYFASENIRENKEVKYFLQENFKESICFTLVREILGNPIVMLRVSTWNSWESNRSSYTWTETRRLCHCIYHWSWAACCRGLNFSCKNHPSHNESSTNRNQFLIICWKFVWRTR